MVCDHNLCKAWSSEPYVAGELVVVLCVGNLHTVCLSFKFVDLFETWSSQVLVGNVLGRSHPPLWHHSQPRKVHNKNMLGCLTIGAIDGG